ncbi:l-allo-threonine aldolase [Aspergillus tamarii]|uniref:L-allo-threonine aldolase n=1 Tax=Aspergillus tamarii TaxID=41984 RepID=A0A5N6URS9_ASPTM|nr:l-allo-threonine aldolase [Aspergillus tamarii]
MAPDIETVILSLSHGSKETAPSSPTRVGYIPEAQSCDTPSGKAADNAQRFPNLSWTDSSKSSNDFRSDIFTRPTLPMLEAIVNTTLGDCTADEDETTVSFQEYVADLVGHEAALLVMSGTMGNQVALRSILRTPPHAILADHRGHIATLEGGGAASICGAMIKAIVPSNGHHLTLHDIQEQSVLRETVFDCPTRVISLENTLSGTIMPLSDIRAISLWARAQNPPIHMHLDGARLWEAVAAGACTLREIGECFDSIQLCLTKALGAPLGSVVTGSASFIKRAKWSRHLFGGGIRSSGIITAPARVAIRDVFFGGKISWAQDKARRAARLWQDLGGKLQQPTETNMVWLDLPASRVDRDEFYALGHQLNLKISNSLMVGRLVFHYQISDAAFTRLCELFESVLKGRTVQSVNSE